MTSHGSEKSRYETVATSLTDECYDTTHGKTANFYKSAQWAPDGTTIITSSENNTITTFIVPPDLLEPRDEALRLEPYARILSKEPMSVLACYPGFDLQNTATTLILSATNQHPIRLNSALTGGLVASYPLVSPTTEAYLRPQSLLFSRDGSTFLAGSDSLLSTFHVSRSGDGPASSIKTGPRRAKGNWANPGTALKGLLAALDIDTAYNVLAVGTLSRQIGLYDNGGQGECIGVFSTVGTEADEVISGAGITQAIWSHCGRYLHMAERMSSGTMVYDIRKTGQLLSWTTGRCAMTSQRMRVELFKDRESGREDLFAGGTDGLLRQWTAPHLFEGAVEPSFEDRMHAAALNSVHHHISAPVTLTAEGTRTFDSSPARSSLKVSRILAAAADKEESGTLATVQTAAI